jgi:dipicolinate synthase subunit A
MPVFGGRISPSVAALAKQHGVALTDYAQSDELQIRNAVPTAEGAICLAMQALDITLDGAYVAILGYGRIGAALAERLRALGAHVTVVARKSRDVARIQCAHCRAIHLTGEESLTPLTAGYAVIFNTIPHRVLTSHILEGMPAKTILMELASAPRWMGCRCNDPVPDDLRTGAARQVRTAVGRCDRGRHVAAYA